MSQSTAWWVGGPSTEMWWYLFVPKDESGNGNHGTVNGATLTQDHSGNANMAYSFDGIYSSINCGPISNGNFSSNNNFSISFWFNPSGQSYGRIFTFWPNSSDLSFALQCTFERNKKIAFNCSQYTAQANAPYAQVFPNNLFTINSWCFVTLTYANHKLKVYKNNIVLDSSLYSGPIATHGIQSVLRFGMHPLEPNERFSGKLDDFGIWNRALNEHEITLLYQEKMTTNSSIAESNLFNNAMQNYTTPKANSNQNVRQFYNQSNRIETELTELEGIYYDGDVVFNGFIVSLNQGQPSTKYEIQAGKPKGVFTSYHYNSNFKKENYEDTDEIRKLEKLNEEYSLKIKSLIDDTTKNQKELAAFIDNDIGGVKKLAKILAKKSENKLREKQQQLWERYNSFLNTISNAKNSLTSYSAKLTVNEQNLVRELNKPQFIPMIKEEYDYEGQIKNGEYIEFYENGKIKRKGMFSDNLYNGNWVYYFENGNIRAEGEFINGNGKDDSESSIIPRNGREGIWIFYYESGEKERESMYKSGKINGEFKLFFKNGKIESVNTRVNDFAFGAYSIYFENGELKEKGNFYNDKVDGNIKQYNESGNLLYEINYYQGIKHGTEREFFPSGKIKKEFQYKNGKQDGISKEYYENGNIKSEITMRNNKEHGAFKSYFENGKIQNFGTIDTTSLAEMSLLGEFKQYNESGSIKASGIAYKDGRIEDTTPKPKSKLSQAEINKPYKCKCCKGTINGIIDGVDQNGNSANVLLLEALYESYSSPETIDAMNTGLAWSFSGEPPYKTAYDILRRTEYKFCTMKCSKTCH